jgi:hypothetical protein
MADMSLCRCCVVRSVDKVVEEVEEERCMTSSSDFGSTLFLNDVDGKRKEKSIHDSSNLQRIRFAPQRNL